MNTRTLLTIISFVVFMSGGVTGPINSLYLESLGAGYAAIGLIGTVTSLTVIALSYIWGRTSDRLGRRKDILVAGLLVMAVSNTLIALVPSFLYIIPLRILSGAATSAYATSSLALMGDELEHHTNTRGRRMGVFRGLGSLGFGIMAFLSGGIADRFSLRVPFFMAGGFYLIGFFVSLAVKENKSTDRRTGNTRDGDTRSEETNNRDVATPTLPLAPLLISAFLWSLVTGAVYAVWANYMVKGIGYTATAMSRLWSLASTSEFPLMIAAGWISDRFGRIRTLILAFIAWTIVFAGYVIIPGMPWILFIQLTRGFAYSAFTATAMTYATEVRSRSKRGEASGLYNSAGGLGSILGSSIGGIQTQLMGFRTMIGTNAALVFGGAVYLTGVVLRKRSQKAK